MKELFNELFVLEMTNNHLGSLERGLQIIEAHSKVVAHHSVKAAIKLQFRNLDDFVHPNYRNRFDLRYIRRITETRLEIKDYRTLVNTIQKSGCIPMATPFDEESVALCQELDLPIIKIASASSNDWPLLNRISQTRRPVIASVAGLSLRELDELVFFFSDKNIPIALNHCVAAYPTEDSDLQLNQIDLLVNRYPHIVIGFSSHEYNDWVSSVQIAYAKGARLFERHIDISPNEQFSPYSSTPEQIGTWFRAFQKAKEMCGAPSGIRVLPNKSEMAFFKSYERGVYLKREIDMNECLQEDDCFFAIPLLPGQISSKEIRKFIGKALRIKKAKDSPLIKSDLN